MKLITEPREDDDLSTFGTLVRFAALVYENEDEGDSINFAPFLLDADVAIVANRPGADQLFDDWVKAMKAAEPYLIDEGNDEAMVALFETDRGLMIIAGSIVEGFDGPNLRGAPVTHYVEGLSHVTAEKIAEFV